MNKNINAIKGEKTIARKNRITSIKTSRLIRKTGMVMSDMINPTRPVYSTLFIVVFTLHSPYIFGVFLSSHA